MTDMTWEARVTKELAGEMNQPKVEHSRDEQLSEICVRHGFCGPFSKIPAAKALAMAAEAYSAGAEQMRERAVQVVRDLELIEAPGGGTEYAETATVDAAVKAIRNLPVGESSRAPEGSQP